MTITNSITPDVSGFDNFEKFSPIPEAAGIILAIWKSGDRDEASGKHILHASDAIEAGDNWYDAKDYLSPGFPNAVRDNTGAVSYDESMKNIHFKVLDLYWKRLVEIHKEKYSHIPFGVMVFQFYRCKSVQCFYN